jgi:hypothetical protein
MKWHRHKGIELLARKSRVGEALGKNPAEGFCDPDFAAVFHTVNQLAYDTAAAHNRHGALKMKCGPTAIRALEFASHAIERLGTHLTARRVDKLNGARAFRAKILPCIDTRGATRAVRWEKERNERLKKDERHGGGRSKQRDSSREEQKPESDP